MHNSELQLETFLHFQLFQPSGCVQQWMWSIIFCRLQMILCLCWVWSCFLDACRLAFLFEFPTQNSWYYPTILNYLADLPFFLLLTFLMRLQYVVFSCLLITFVIGRAEKDLGRLSLIFLWWFKPNPSFWSLTFYVLYSPWLTLWVKKILPGHKRQEMCTKTHSSEKEYHLNNIITLVLIIFVLGEIDDSLLELSK